MRLYNWPKRVLTRVARSAYWHATHIVSHRTVGRVVEHAGGILRTGGVRLDISSRLISTELKGQLALGLYEREERCLVRRYLPPSLPLIELGGGIGFISCIANARLQNAQHHVVVEANAAVLPEIEKNRVMNRCCFEVTHAAVFYDGLEAGVARGDCFLGASVRSRAGNDGYAPATTLQYVADARGFDRFSLICDIEGAEVELIARELPYMVRHVCCLIIELHPHIEPEVGMKVDRPLREAGFEVVDRYGETICYHNTRFALAARPA